MKESRFRLALLTMLPGRTTPTLILRQVPEFDLKRLVQPEWPNSCEIPLAGTCTGNEDIKAAIRRVLDEKLPPELATKLKDGVDKDRPLELSRNDTAAALTVNYCLVVPAGWFSKVDSRGLRFIEIDRAQDIKDRGSFDKAKGVQDGSIALDAEEAEVAKLALEKTKHFIL
jgi:hypothetical protein